MPLYSTEHLTCKILKHTCACVFRVIKKLSVNICSILGNEFDVTSFQLNVMFLNTISIKKTLPIQCHIPKNHILWNGCSGARIQAKIFGYKEMLTLSIALTHSLRSPVSPHTAICRQHISFLWRTVQHRRRQYLVPVKQRIRKVNRLIKAL